MIPRIWTRTIFLFSFWRHKSKNSRTVSHNEKTQKQSSDSSLTKRLRPSYKMDDVNDKSQGFYFFWSFDKIVMSFFVTYFVTNYPNWYSKWLTVLMRWQKAMTHYNIVFTLWFWTLCRWLNHTCGCFFLYVEKQRHTLYYSDHDWQSLIFDEESFGYLFCTKVKLSSGCFYMFERQRHTIRIVWSLLMP